MKTIRTIKSLSRQGWLAAVLILGTATILCSCSHDDDPVGADEPTAAVFNAGIQATRTTSGGNKWTTDDKVGIFMLATGGDLTTPAEVLTANKQYNVTDAAIGTLSPEGGTPIYYPQSDNVDFIAYYPYGTAGTGAGNVTADYKYNITVAGQENGEAAQNALDVLYAKTTGVAKTKTAVGLTFDHVLSKVTLNVTLGDGLASLSGGDITAASFSGMPQTATLALQDGTLTAGSTGDFKALKAATSPGGVDAAFTALLIPQPTGGTGRTAVFTVDGTEYIWTIPATEKFEKGNHYTYPVTVGLSGVTVGTPSITKWNTNDNGTGAATEIGAGIEKVKIPAGTFSMGEAGWGTPVHEVTLTKDFYMSKYQITNAQYAAFLNAKSIGDTGEGTVIYYKDNFTTPVTESQRFIYTHTKGVTYDNGAWKAQTGYENHPVIYVTWYGATAFAEWSGGRLPTEAEWEYACRAGSVTPFYFGADESALGDYGWSWENSSDGTKAVGLKLPNAFGLYDMHGNVWEWCSDWYGSYSDDTVSDPPGPSGGISRVLRGGSWGFNALHCRSAIRNFNLPDDWNGNVGFRVAFVP